jgi:16S rRNA (uracil1498-N3)-methyltransferase
LGRVAAHVFVHDLSAGRPVLADDDLHHLSRVLRLRAGELVSVSDGRGGVQVCEWAGGAALEPVGELVRHPRPVPLLTVGFSLTKGDHPGAAVQKLTEAGADRVVVVTSARCVARWPSAKQDRQLQRLREVARQAAMQSRRTWLPVVDGPVPFAAFAAGEQVGLRSGAAVEPRSGAAGEQVGLRSGAAVEPTSGGIVGPSASALAATPAAVALAVLGGEPLSLSTPTVLIGPEGGWTDEELAGVPHHVGLGPHVLRAETAAVAAGVLLAALRAGLVAATS